MKKLHAILERGSALLTSTPLFSKSSLFHTKQLSVSGSPAGRPIGIRDEVNTVKISKRIKKLKKRTDLIVDTIRQNGLYDLLVGGVSPKEQEIWAVCDKTGQKCLSNVDHVRDTYINKRISLMKQLEEETHEQRKERFIRHHAEAMNMELSAAEKPLAEIEVLQNEQGRIQNNKEKAEARRDKVCKKLYDEIAPVKGPLHSSLVYWGHYHFAFTG